MNVIVGLAYLIYVS